jgi:hypothetical protein
MNSRASIVLVAAVMAGAAVAEPPEFTFSMGIAFDQSFACSYCRDTGQWGGCPRPAPWFRADVTSAGSIQKQGNVPFDVQVAFESNGVRWTLIPSINELKEGVGCSDECCAGNGLNNHRFLPLPSVSCGIPMYPPYAGYSDCRPDQYWGTPVMAVIAEDVPDPNGCSMPAEWILPRYQSGVVRYTFCRADFDANGSIDGGDIAVLLAEFGSYIYFAQRVDLDDSGEVDAADLAILLLDWGSCDRPAAALQPGRSERVLLNDETARTPR